MRLTAFLEDLERRIDPEVEDRLLADWLDFWEGRTQDAIFSPRRVRLSPPAVAWPRIGINDAIADPELMAIRELAGCSEFLKNGTSHMLAVRSNYGTGILPSVFGAELFFMDPEMDTLPTSIPLSGGLKAMRALAGGAEPDIRTGLGARVFDMAARFQEWMKPYPKVSRYVHLYHPDLQGPMDVCELLWGSGMFLDLVDRPELVHAVLRRIADTYLRFMRAWERLVPPPEGYATHWSLVHRGRIMLRDDSAMNLSPAMYDEFIRPYDARLLAELGGGVIHFCGRGSHYIESMCSTPGLFAIQMSQPELNDMETVYRNTVDRGLPLLGFNRGTAEKDLAGGRDLRRRVHCW